MIRISTDRFLAELRFPYDEDALGIVRSIPGRRWHADGKFWTIPATEARLAATRFHRAGFSVELDGETYKPAPDPPPRPPPSSSGRNRTVDLFVDLLLELPERLRTPAYKALAGVLHPDRGGDLELMQRLNRAKDDHLGR